MSSKQKKKGKSKGKTPLEPESEWIEFIKQEKAVVPFLAHESGIPVEIPSVADESEYEAIPEKNPFQAHLPILSSKKDYFSDPGNLKWYVTKIWPRNETSQEIDNSSIQEERSAQFNSETIANGDRSDGKGKRPECVYNSNDVRVEQEIQRLKAELGPAYESWKFDKMGEHVADSWTLREIRKFNSVMKKRNHPSSEGKSFLEPAMKVFPGKSRAELVSYYFNFYVPNWRIRKQTNSGCTAAEIDTDDDGPTKIRTEAGGFVGDAYLSRGR